MVTEAGMLTDAALRTPYTIAACTTHWKADELLQFTTTSASSM